MFKFGKKSRNGDEESRDGPAGQSLDPSQTETAMSPSSSRRLTKSELDKLKRQAIRAPYLDPRKINAKMNEWFPEELWKAKVNQSLHLSSDPDN
jgi:hypothetical protein